VLSQPWDGARPTTTGPTTGTPTSLRSPMLGVSAGGAKSGCFGVVSLSMPAGVGENEWRVGVWKSAAATSPTSRDGCRRMTRPGMSEIERWCEGEGEDSREKEEERVRGAVMGGLRSVYAAGAASGGATSAMLWVCVSCRRRVSRADCPALFAAVGGVVALPIWAVAAVADVGVAAERGPLTDACRSGGLSTSTSAIRRLSIALDEPTLGRRWTRPPPALATVFCKCAASSCACADAADAPRSDDSWEYTDSGDAAVSRIRRPSSSRSASEEA
jgi:hypothetical protein